MKARSVLLGIIGIGAVAGYIYGQMHGRGGMEGGMGERCPMCGRQWEGNNNYAPGIPDSLPRPDNKKWVQRFGGIMAKERLSLAQYRKDAEKYSLHMPYSMVIPQEDNHIEWITKLYEAFGMLAPDSIPPLKETDSGRQALRVGMELEQELIPEYEWLIKNTRNETVQQVLADILYQTRMHYTMFQHASSMGNMMR